MLLFLILKLRSFRNTDVYNRGDMCKIDTTVKDLGQFVSTAGSIILSVTVHFELCSSSSCRRTGKVCAVLMQQLHCLTYFRNNTNMQIMHAIICLSTNPMGFTTVKFLFVLVLVLVLVLIEPQD